MPSGTREADPIVHIIDDDDDIRDALEGLLASVGRSSFGYRSAVEFLEKADCRSAGCILTDVRLPRLGGLELQSRLVEEGIDLPVVLMSGHADIPMTVRGMKGGAVDFLLKPLRDQDVLDATDAAIERDRRARSEGAGRRRAGLAYDSLSAREREVMSLIVAGRKNREVADELCLSEITVKIHRGALMRKMGVRNIQDLVRVDAALRLSVIAPGVRAA